MGRPLTVAAQLQEPDVFSTHLPATTKSASNRAHKAIAAIMLLSQVLLESNLMRAAKRAKGNGKHTRRSVLKILADRREEVRRFGVRSLGLFGSAARGEATATSDLDFLVEFENPNFDSYMDLLEYLENLFGHRVDLVLGNTLKPRLRESILRETVHAPGL